MARETLSISSGVLEHLKRLGLEAPAGGDELTTDEFRTWERTTPLRFRAARG
jgi:hypothetical protein